MKKIRIALDWIGFIMVGKEGRKEKESSVGMVWQ